MKKFLYSALLFVASAAILTSCQKEIKPIVEQSTTAKLAQDDNFKKMMTSAVTLSSSISGVDITSDDAAIILEIVKKGNNASKAELSFVQEKLGVSSETFGTELGDFLSSIATLEKTYSFSKMNESELNDVITGAINLNPEIKKQLTSVSYANGKAEVTGAGICRLVVLLASTFGGSALCGAIGVSTIPVVGGVLCTALVSVATNILNAICDLIP